MDFTVSENASLHKYEICAKDERISFTLHPELDGLIWFSDGPLKNYFPRKSTYETAGIAFECEALKEPSALQMDLPVRFSNIPIAVPKPGYYPSYSELLPEQRGLYFESLRNPYDSLHDIGYIFLLYYGLERHLIMGKYEQAFNVILRLRSVHKNPSFQDYSLMALLICSILHRRHDLAQILLNSLSSPKKADFNTLLLIKSVAGSSLSGDELILYARRFGFTNVRYIKSNPVIFKNALSDLLESEFNEAGIALSFLTSGYAPKISGVAFANYSLPREIQIPNYSVVPGLIRRGLNLLSQAHEKTKIVLSKSRTQTQDK